MSEHVFFVLFRASLKSFCIQASDAKALKHETPDYCFHVYFYCPYCYRLCWCIDRNKAYEYYSKELEAPEPLAWATKRTLGGAARGPSQSLAALSLGSEQ